MFTVQDTSASAKLGAPLSATYASKDDTAKYFVMTDTNLKVGDRVYQGNAGTTFLIDRIDVHTVQDDSGTTTTSIDEIRASVRSTDDISAAAAGPAELLIVAPYKYYGRLNAVDSNSRVVGSAAIGHQDFIVDYDTDGQIVLRLLRPPLYGNYDVEKWELELYRTTANGEIFYFHSRQAVTWTANNPYAEVYDGVLDGFIEGNDDLVHNSLLGGEIGPGWDQPPRAKHISSNKGRLILGNIKSYPELSVTITSDDASALLADSDLNGAVFTFMRDGTATASGATDNTNEVRFEFVTSTVATSVFNEVTFVDTDVTVGAGDSTIDISKDWMVTGDAVVITDGGSGLPAELTSGTTYYVIKDAGNLIKLATTEANALAGTKITLTTTGGATPNTVVNQTRFMATGITGVAAADWVYIFLDSAADTDIRVAGWWQVSNAETAGEATFLYSGSSSITNNQIYAAVKTTTAGDVPVYIGASTDDLNFTMRDGNPASSSASVELQAARRLAKAINATQRAVDITLAGQDTFTPWLLANAGNDFQLGQLVVSSPLSETTTPELIVPTISGFSVFVEDLKRTSAEQVGFVVRSHPSRMVRSYPNYPEIFDLPFTLLTEESDSAIDVNPEDGQEIKGFARFFGTSATGQGEQLSEEIVVFKTNSVYVVNTETKKIQYVDSRGLGCTAPKSIATTRNGIMFSNESGLYMLTRQLEVVHIGLQLERKWKRLVNLDQLAEATGHHWGTGRKYKLSFPAGSDSTNSGVFVFDYDSAPGQPPRAAWTRYDNHNATGWVNFGKEAYWSSTEGDVFLVRNRGEAQDFRDEDQAVSSQEITLKAEDFGMPGSRKLIDKIMLMFDLDLTDITSVAVQQAKDLSTTFESLSSVTGDIDTDPYITVKVALKKKRTNYIQLKFTHSVKDEQMVLVGVVYQVRELNSSLMKEPTD
jgi:hypothetical protein